MKCDDKHYKSQLDSIYDNIIKEEIEIKMIEEEGGSDSEDDAEDLDEI